MYNWNREFTRKEKKETEGYVKVQTLCMARTRGSPKKGTEDEGLHDDQRRVIVKGGNASKLRAAWSLSMDRMVN